MLARCDVLANRVNVLDLLVYIKIMSSREKEKKRKREKEKKRKREKERERQCLHLLMAQVIINLGARYLGPIISRLILNPTIYREVKFTSCQGANDNDLWCR
jgi:hypothetical protein